LSDRAYDAIKQAILSLELQPGEFMSIGSLASQLDVSRTPVREALLLLEKEGLVSLVPHKGAYVSELSVRDVEGDI
jgi:DNA-binding GntR family transcriptional regulator